MKAENLKVGEIYKVAGVLQLPIHLVNNQTERTFVSSVQLVSISQNKKTVIVAPLEEINGEEFFCYYVGHKIQITLNMETFLEIIKDDIDTENKTTPPQLEDGMVVEFRNKKIGIVIKDRIYDCSFKSIIHTSNLTDSLVYKHSRTDYLKGYDIMNVYSYSTDYGLRFLNNNNNNFDVSHSDLIWARRTPVKVTQQEINDKFGYEVEIVE